MVWQPSPFQRAQQARDDLVAGLQLCGRDAAEAELVDELRRQVRRLGATIDSPRIEREHTVPRETL